jgi:hypothetical protein
VGENSGLSEQPAGRAHGIRGLRHDAISKVITGFVNTLLGQGEEDLAPLRREERSSIERNDLENAGGDFVLDLAL